MVGECGGLNAWERIWGRLFWGAVYLRRIGVVRLKSGKRMRMKPRDVYVVGAGFSAGLGFPTITDLMPKIWPRLVARGISNDLANVIRFHHPEFNPRLKGTYPNVERLLSEMQANEDLFASSRRAVGQFSQEELTEIKRKLLVEMAAWFHEIKCAPLAASADWARAFAERVKRTKAQVISFNWDLVLDQLLFGEELDASKYGFSATRSRPELIKPHGSLNWYNEKTASHIKSVNTFDLCKGKGYCVKVFKPFRAVISKSDREYMPLIVPPVYAKQFTEAIFQRLWRRSVEIVSSASRVFFVGYSLADADFHARFILRCGFYNQEHGRLRADGKRTAPTGRAEVFIIDPSDLGPARIRGMLGRDCLHLGMTAEKWVESW